jgi:choline dehydrogenase-like flavoprotein
MNAPHLYLPPNTHPHLLLGYVEQLKVMAQQYGGSSSSVFELPFGGSSLFYPIFLRPLSRGTVYLDPHDDGVDPNGLGRMEPRVNYRTLSNPVDMQTTAEMVKWFRRFVGTPAMADVFRPVEISPGGGVVVDEDIIAYVARTGVPGNGHASGTARMGAAELGGVVGPDLLVHGVHRLSVADCSVVPLIPGTHTSSTVYAVAEKAATMILRRAALAS